MRLRQGGVMDWSETYRWSAVLYTDPAGATGGAPGPHHEWNRFLSRTEAQAKINASPYGGEIHETTVEVEPHLFLHWEQVAPGTAYHRKLPVRGDGCRWTDPIH